MYYSIVVLFVLLAILVTERVATGKALTPISICCIWWLSWLFISCFSFTGIFRPSLSTQVITTVFVISMFIGAHIPAARHMARCGLVSSSERKLYFKLLKICFVASCVILAIIGGPYFIRSLYMLATMDGNTFKSTAFSTTETVGLLFGNRLIENLYFFISSPLLLYVLIYGIASFFVERKMRPFALGLFFNVMDAVLRLARASVYIVILLFLVMLVSSHVKIRISRRNRRILVGSLVLSFILILAVGVNRGTALSRQAELFVIDYQTTGFALFDSELVDPKSPLNTERTNGRLTIGGLETVLTLAIRQFDRQYYSPALANAIRMSQYKEVGVEDPPTPQFNGKKVYNSFYTLLYTFYSDARWVGIILGGLVLGVVIGGFWYRYSATGELWDYMWLILAVFICIISILISQLEIMRTWMVIIWFWLIRSVVVSTRSVACWQRTCK